MSNTIDLKKLGHTIRFLRQGRGWGLAELSARSGVSKAYISDLENGLAGKPNVQYVYSLATALDVTLDRLLNDATQQESVKTKLEPNLPPGLSEIKEEMGLSDQDVATLASMNFRGHRPRDKEGWRYLLETLRMLSQRRRNR
jgi:transcriptional regulator with XRE-family HTH domain